MVVKTKACVAVVTHIDMQLTQKMLNDAQPAIASKDVQDLMSKVYLYHFADKMNGALGDDEQRQEPLNQLADYSSTRAAT